MTNNLKIIVILLLLIIGGTGFFAGTKYQQSKQPNFLRQFGNRQGIRTNGQLQGHDNRMGFRPVSGEIISNDNKSITVKLQDGSSKIVLFSDKTEINKAATASAEDLKKGEKVAVFGQENADGSVTAQNIQLNPQIRVTQPAGQ